jgi:HlyD family secretion protein
VGPQPFLNVSTRAPQQGGTSITVPVSFGSLKQLTMQIAMRRNGLRAAATASLLVVALSVAACGKIPGIGGTGDSSGSADDTTQTVDAVSASSPAAALPANPTPTTAARPGANQPIAAHIGTIAQTLSLVGKVSAPDEVPLSFGERLAVKSVQVKAGQSVEEGQVLITADSTDIQRSLDAAQAVLDGDVGALAQAQAAAAAAQRAAEQQAVAAQQAHADQVAAAQANLTTARANLQRVQAGPSQSDVLAAQNAVTAAEIAERSAQSDQDKLAAGPDPTQVRSAEQELANAQAAVSKAQSDFDKLTGGQAAGDVADPNQSGQTNPQAPLAAAENISPPGVSVDFGNPPNNYGFQGIAIDPNDPSTLYVGTCYEGLWKTTDAGKTWAKVNTGTNGKALDSGRLWLVSIDPTNGQTVYAAPGYGVGGLWKSTDGGVNWTALFPTNSPVTQQLGGPPTPSNLAFDPANHQHIIASSHFPWGGKFGNSGGGVFESNDGGTSWTIHPIPGSAAEQVVGLIDGSTWLDSYASGTYRTTDGGGSWTKVSDANSNPAGLLAVNDVLYLPASSGLLRSLDHGASWDVAGPGGLAVVSDGVNLFTQQSGPGGFDHPEPLRYAPLSQMENWADYSSQSMCAGGKCNGAGWMTYDPTNHVMYMSDWGAGVWKLQTIGGRASAPAPLLQANAAAASSPNVAAARQRLQAAKDTADAARARLAAVKGTDPNSLDTAQLSVEGAQGALQAAQVHLDEVRRGPAPADVRAAQDAVNQAQAALDRARAGTGPNNDATDGAGADIDARQKTIEKDQAEVAKLQDRLAGTQLVAPFTGTVVSIRVRVGDVVDETHPAATMAMPATSILKATVTPGDFDKISVGQTAFIQLPGQADTATPLTGKVTALTPNDAGTAKVARIDVDWPDAPPKLGAAMTVGLVLQQKDDAVLVPKKAIHTVGSRSYVELVDGSSKKAATVQVGIIGSADAEIVSGLTQGQLVAIGP